MGEAEGDGSGGVPVVPRRLAAPFASGGEVGAHLAELDWSRTAVGPPEGWPQSLRTVVRVLLTSRFSMWMAWGEELTFFCNDAYRRDTLGTKFPWALGRPAREVWEEIWPDIGPRIAHVMGTGEATWDEALLLFLERSGYVEETYHTFSYSPLGDDEGRVAGMLCVVSEDTDRVIAERRMATLRDLGSEPPNVEDEHEYLLAAARHLAANPRSLPFTLTYLFDEDAMVARRVALTGIDPGHPAASTAIAAFGARPPWPIDELREGREVIVEGIDHRFAGLPTGARGEPPTSALAAPLLQPGGERPYGFLVAALNRHRPLDDDYRAFVGLVAQRLAAGIAAARSYAAERRRAQDLAELDRAKTAFFSNVSHELRTPLTLMLGPLGDAHAAGEALDPGQVALMHRNALRLLKLVNGLLDFSRSEAGRMRAAFRPVDLAALTAELAGTFREATDRAGLELVIDCEPLPEPAYVDPDLWERIVLNLLSNAFKFTLEGRIAVRLRPVDGRLELSVADTGPGIAPDDLEQLFQRFQRLTTREARSHEGTGIGLALVKELTEQHGGTVAVESVVGEGSRFSVRIPRGRAHLPAEQVHDDDGAPRAASASLFVEEALAWLPAGTSTEVAAEIASDGAPADERVLDAARRVLIADDNPDLRAYLTRLLSPHWRVEAVSDGETALAAVRENPPDLLVTDAMMPGLDGFELVAAVRADPATRELPVIMLSARAGEEAAIEGLQAGADDYLPKPFSGRELLARVRANLELSRVRRDARAALSDERRRLEQTIEQLPVGVILAEAPSGRLVMANDRVEEMLGHRFVAAESVEEYEAHRGLTPAGEPLPARGWPLARAIRDGEVVRDEDLLYETGRGRRITVRLSAAPIHDEAGRIFAAVAVMQDVTEQLRIERLLAAQRDVLEMVARREPLTRILEAIAGAVDELSATGARSSVLLRSADGKRLEHGAGPSLPEAYNRAIDGIAIGPDTGSCGAAAYSGETVVATDVRTDPRWLRFRELAATHGLRACWSTPIQATDGELVGTFAVYHDEPHAPTDEERRLVELFARTAAVAIEGTRDARARARQLAELQESLLPRALAEIPGLDVAAAFHPATRGLDVGGDFYDVFPLREDAWGFVIGDVRGHGAAAAAVTALTRHTTRTVALLRPEPRQVLETVNAALLASDYDRFCTAVYGVVRPHPAGATLRLACGGHPPPLVRRADGRVESLSAHGPLLGIFDGPLFPEISVELSAGDVLLLYTDGLIERNPRLGDERRLSEVLAAASGPDAAGLVHEIEREAIGSRLPDDIAILLLRARELEVVRADGTPSEAAAGRRRT
ncbi:MAG TPA: SpoIIE family protein phosphatase [Solirubrobacteraceae bacterium]|nr:SpoIIE family protein phosphatase [Solirubrobacteraceae bacterium]